MEEKLDGIEKEEEEIVAQGGKLTESMVGRRRILTTWAVGEAWEVFCRERMTVVQCSFCAVGLVGMSHILGFGVSTVMDVMLS